MYKSLIINFLKNWKWVPETSFKIPLKKAAHGAAKIWGYFKNSFRLPDLDQTPGFCRCFSNQWFMKFSGSMVIGIRGNTRPPIIFEAVEKATNHFANGNVSQP